MSCTKYKDKRKRFNKQKSVKFLRHETREEKPQFEPIVDPKHLTSVICVKPKLTNDRLKSQKGFYFLFGLNEEDAYKPIKLIVNNELNEQVSSPIKKIWKIIITADKIPHIRDELKNIGIVYPSIYPEMDKVAEYLKNKYKH